MISVSHLQWAASPYRGKSERSLISECVKDFGWREADKLACGTADRQPRSVTTSILAGSNTCC
jgi:hypothetical protein